MVNMVYTNSFKSKLLSEGQFSNTSALIAPLTNATLKITRVYRKQTTRNA